MTNTELLYEGINLMVAGIGFVMLFLLILIYAIIAMSKIINRFFPEQTLLASQPSNTQLTIAHPPTPATEDFTDLRPVIVAAIAHHRHQQGLK